MNDPARDNGVAPEDGRGNTLYKKDFWAEENLKFSEPWYRPRKAARIVARIAGAKRTTLLDVGCGPAVLARLLPANIEYFGMDIAIHDPAPNLIEADFLETPIGFGSRRFDIVIAQGVFEYVGTFQRQKFAEIAGIMNENGKFIVSYTNFGHRRARIYWPFSNIQPINDFRRDLQRYFTIERYFPASHNWAHRSPSRKVLMAINMHLNLNIPVAGPRLAVEYFFVCSLKHSTHAGSAVSEGRDSAFSADQHLLGSPRARHRRRR